MRLMMRPFRCPHLLAKPLCIPQAPFHCMYGLVLNSFTYFLLNQYWPFPVLSTEEAPCFITQWMQFRLFILGMSLPQVSMLYPILFFFVVWKSGLMTDFISQNLLPIVYLAVQSQWPCLHVGWMGGPTLTQFNKKNNEATQSS